MNENVIRRMTRLIAKKAPDGGKSAVKVSTTNSCIPNYPSGTEAHKNIPQTDATNSMIGSTTPGNAAERNDREHTRKFFAVWSCMLSGNQRT